MTRSGQIFAVLDVLTNSVGEFVNVRGRLVSDPGPAPIFELHGEIRATTMSREMVDGESQGAGGRVIIGETLTTGPEPRTGPFTENCLYLKPSQITGVRAARNRLYLYFGDLEIEIKGGDAFLELLQTAGLVNRRNATERDPS
jgi:hypothetical protein